MPVMLKPSVSATMSLRQRRAALHLQYLADLYDPTLMAAPDRRAKLQAIRLAVAQLDAEIDSQRSFQNSQGAQRCAPRRII